LKTPPESSLIPFSIVQFFIYALEYLIERNPLSLLLLYIYIYIKIIINY